MAEQKYNRNLIALSLPNSL